LLVRDLVFRADSPCAQSSSIGWGSRKVGSFLRNDRMLLAEHVFAPANVQTPGSAPSADPARKTPCAGNHPGFPGFCVRSIPNDLGSPSNLTPSSNSGRPTETLRSAKQLTEFEKIPSLNIKSRTLLPRRMNAALVAPQLPRLSRKTAAVSNPAKRARKNELAQRSKIGSKRRSFQKLEDVLEALLTMLSVAYFIGAASFAGILLIHAFSN
jgi:hypothetical protein